MGAEIPGGWYIPGARKWSPIYGWLYCRYIFYFL